MTETEWLPTHSGGSAQTPIPASPSHVQAQLQPDEGRVGPASLKVSIGFFMPRQPESYSLVLVDADALEVVNAQPHPPAPIPMRLLPPIPRRQLGLLPRVFV